MKLKPDAKAQVFAPPHNLNTNLARIMLEILQVLLQTNMSQIITNKKNQTFIYCYF